MAKVVAVGGVQLFINGWFCPKCDCVTEHVEVKENLRCSECGFAKPINKHKDEVSAKKRAWREAHKDEVNECQRDYRKRKRLEKKLEAVKMEDSILREGKAGLA